MLCHYNLPQRLQRGVHTYGYDQSQVAQANHRWLASAAMVEAPEGPYFAYSRYLVYLRHFGKIELRSSTLKPTIDRDSSRMEMFEQQNTCGFIDL